MSGAAYSRTNPMPNLASPRPGTAPTPSGWTAQRQRTTHHHVQSHTKTNPRLWLIHACGLQFGGRRGQAFSVPSAQPSCNAKFVCRALDRHHIQVIVRAQQGIAPSLFVRFDAAASITSTSRNFFKPDHQLTNTGTNRRAMHGALTNRQK